MSFESLLATLRQTVPSVRARTFHSPVYSLPSDSKRVGHTTVSQLLASIDEFEAAKSMESRRPYTLENITVPEKAPHSFGKARSKATRNDEGDGSSMDVHHGAPADHVDPAHLDAPWLMLCWREKVYFSRLEASK